MTDYFDLVFLLGGMSEIVEKSPKSEENPRNLRKSARFSTIGQFSRGEIN